MSVAGHRVWSTPTATHTAVADSERRRHSQLVATLLVTLAPLGLLASTLPGLLRPDPVFPDHRVVSVALACVVWTLAYRVARTGRYEVATLITASVATVTVYAIAVLDRSALELFYLTLPVVLCSVVLPLPHTVLFAALSLPPVLVIPLVVEEVSWRVLMVEPVTFLGLATVLVILAASHRRGIERDRATVLRESEARYRGLFEATFDGIAELIDGDIDVCNTGLARMLGSTPDILVGQELESFVYDTHRDAFRDALAHGRATPLPVSGKRATGETFHAEIVFRTRSPDTYGRRHLIAARDVTDQQNAERALHDAQRLDSIGLLAGGVAHDYNNILMAVLGNAELADERHRTGEDVRPQLQTILESARRAGKLTAQLLAYAGRSMMQRDDHDLNAIISEQRLLVESALPPGVWLDVNLGDDVPAVHCDAAQIGQVLLNVLLNGAEAMPKGGALRLATTVSDIRTSSFDALGGPALSSGRYALVEIRDNGVGMGDETQRRMFDPFYTTKPTGHGLGLAASAGILRAHGAGVRVESTPGEGSTIVIALPASTREEVPTAGDESQSDAHTGNGRILVVDDDALVLQTVAQLATTAGYSVVTAPGGAEAVETFGAQPDGFGAVVLDLKMPVMDGEATLREIRAIKPDVPVLFISGFSEPARVRDLLSRHDAGFLPKPFDRDDLVAALDRTVGQAAS